MLNPTRGSTAATLAMANPAAAAQHQARGGDGAAGRPAAEQAQGTSSPRLLVAAPAPAPDQQPRLAGAAGAGGGAPKQAPRGRGQPMRPVVFSGASLVLEKLAVE